MNSTHILQALVGRYPADQYIVLPEVGQDPTQSGRRADALIISLWRSRGLTVEAVEIKTSNADLQRELDQPDKADWWFRHTNRFWLAAPTDLVKKRLDDIPPAWGVIAITPDLKCREARKAPLRTDHTPLPWATIVAAMRAATGAGRNALERAHTNGVAEGHRQAKAQTERDTATARDITGTDPQTLFKWRNAYEREHHLASLTGLAPHRLVHLAKVVDQLHSIRTITDLTDPTFGIATQLARAVETAQRLTAALTILDPEPETQP